LSATLSHAGEAVVGGGFIYLLVESGRDEREREREGERKRN